MSVPFCRTRGAHCCRNPERVVGCGTCDQLTDSREEVCSFLLIVTYLHYEMKTNLIVYLPEHKNQHTGYIHIPVWPNAFVI